MCVNRVKQRSGAVSSYRILTQLKVQYDARELVSNTRVCTIRQARVVIPASVFGVYFLSM